MDKFILFTTGGGRANIMTFNSDEAALYSVNDLKSIKPISKSNVEIIFQTLDRIDTVTLTILGGSQGRVIKGISEAITSGTNPLIRIADVDEDYFINKYIVGVTIKTGTPILYYQKIADATQVNLIPINTKLKRLSSMTLANIHSGDATTSVFLANSTDNWYIIKDAVIPTGTTLKLESDELDYDASIFNLYVKLGGSTPVDVIIR
jgi:hypothetical protein